MKKRDVIGHAGAFSFGLLFLFLLIILPATSAATTNFCADSNTLNITSEIFSNGVKNVTTQNITCPFGCVGPEGGARCNNNSALMPVEIFIFLGSVAFAFFILSFIRTTVLVFPWFAFLIALVLAISSVNLEVNGNHFESVPLSWFWYGTAVLMFAYAMYITIVNVMQGFKKTVEKAGI